MAEEIITKLSTYFESVFKITNKEWLKNYFSSTLRQINGYFDFIRTQAFDLPQAIGSMNSYLADKKLLVINSAIFLFLTLTFALIVGFTNSNYKQKSFFRSIFSVYIIYFLIVNKIKKTYYIEKCYEKIQNVWVDNSNVNTIFKHFRPDLILLCWILSLFSDVFSSVSNHFPGLVFFFTLYNRFRVNILSLSSFAFGTLIVGYIVFYFVVYMYYSDAILSIFYSLFSAFILVAYLGFVEKILRGLAEDLDDFFKCLFKFSISIFKNKAFLIFLILTFIFLFFQQRKKQQSVLIEKHEK